jgi:hypothetical protein
MRKQNIARRLKARELQQKLTAAAAQKTQEAASKNP